MFSSECKSSESLVLDDVVVPLSRDVSHCRAEHRGYRTNASLHGVWQISSGKDLGAKLFGSFSKW